eukprot:Sspe_Gene.83782::Locus_54961_Transcript_1_1_Confidence_1.000_Length_730::g.83782::m.83782
MVGGVSDQGECGGCGPRLAARAATALRDGRKEGCGEEATLSEAMECATQGRWCAVPSDEDSMAWWISHFGPVTAWVAASDWQLYTGGVLTQCTGGADHAVVVVGYTATEWLVQNSWGE